MNVIELYKKILSHDRVALAKAITLIESRSDRDKELAQKLMQLAMTNSGNSLRIGITGSPGAGKSTFIDTFGDYLIAKGRKVAVLAIDPSSTISRGSILGDKTRMIRLAQNENAFVRPSPSKGNLGGVARQTRESSILCEAAGFDVIIIETVGVGQSETAVRSMVDVLMLLILPGGGDELQGIKKGSVELADFLIINKADGENKAWAEITKNDYGNALHLLNSPTEGWTPKVIPISAQENYGIDEVWSSLNEFQSITNANGVFVQRRQSQMIQWVDTLIQNELLDKFYGNDKIVAKKNELIGQVIKGEKAPSVVASELVKLFLSAK